MSGSLYGSDTGMGPAKINILEKKNPLVGYNWCFLPLSVFIYFFSFSYKRERNLEVFFPKPLRKGFCNLLMVRKKLNKNVIAFQEKRMMNLGVPDWRQRGSLGKYLRAKETDGGGLRLCRGQGCERIEEYGKYLGDNSGRSCILRGWLAQL